MDDYSIHKMRRIEAYHRGRAYTELRRPRILIILLLAMAYAEMNLGQIKAT